MSQAPVLIDLKFSDDAAVAAALERRFAGRAVINLADDKNTGRDLSECRYAVLWKPDADLFQRAPQLKVLFSGGAGVDKVLALEGLPDIPLVRFVDPTLTRRMSEYVVLQCLYHLRQMPAYRARQQRAEWEPLPQPEAGAVTVGIMGLGALGLDAARKLRGMGFDVIGWSRSEKAIEGMETFSAAALDTFLERTDMLVGLLPLTVETEGLFSRSLFSKLRQGGALGRPVFINAGRGGSQVEADILTALDDGTLGGASLDVFETEPLSPESLLWARSDVVITPHVASDTDIDAFLAHVERQIARFEAGKPLEYVVARQRGY